MAIKWDETNLEKHYRKHGNRFTSKAQYKHFSEKLINKPVGKGNVWGTDKSGMKIRFDLNTGLFVKSHGNLIVTSFKTGLNYYLKMISNRSHKRQHDI